MSILNTKEYEFLKIISKTLDKNKHLGDDCAYLKNLGLTISHDTLVQDIHFDLSDITPFELGKKSVIVNISDILSSGAKPCYITISLSGNLNNNFISNFYLGVNEICKKYKIEVIGGDLTGGDKITVSVCIIGKCFKNSKISSRKNAKAGYLLCVKGYFGNSSYYLKTKDKKYRKAHIEPDIYPNLSHKIATKTHKKYVMTDSSDGLLASLAQICELSNVGFEIDYNKIPKKIDDRECVLYGGEDFCPIVCIDKNDFKNIKNMTIIGKVTDKKGVFIDNIDYLEKEWRGFNHFE